MADDQPTNQPTSQPTNEPTKERTTRHQYQLWLATPADRRNPSTEAALAERLGVTVMTLHEWRQRHDFWDEVVRLAQLQLRDRLPAILHALADRAEDGHIPAARLVLDALGQSAREPSVTQFVNVAPLTAADFAAVLRDSEVWQALIRQADRTEP
jgi:hypothetical protein